MAIQYLAPYIKPPSCTYQILDERTVYFSWDMIPTQQVPGTLLGYKIKYKKYDEDIFNTAIADSPMTQRTVSTFKPFTWYWVEVAGFTKAGVGPHEVFVFKMPPGGTFYTFYFICFSNKIHKVVL